MTIFIILNFTNNGKVDIKEEDMRTKYQGMKNALTICPKRG
jgi:hypothetical protein